jgi:ABC-type branched-subunit amino acid transport system substrate-binding protein
MGEILESLDRLPESVQLLESAGRYFKGRPHETDVLVVLARVYGKHGMNERAMTILDDLLSRETEPRNVTEITRLMADIFWNENRWSEAFETYVALLKRHPGPAESTLARTRIEAIIEDRFEQARLQQWADLPGREYPSGYALFRLARLYDETGRPHRADALLKEFLEHYPRHPLVEDARALRRSLAERMKVDYYTIGCILPLTGRFAPFGTRILDAVILATGIFDPDRRTPIRLLIRDSGGDPARTRQAVEDLAVTEGVVAVIGPLESSPAVAAAREAQRLGIPIITLTQKDGVADTGDYVFRNFLTTGLQIEALVTYSMNNLGVSRFAILYPDDSYGREMMLRFWYCVAEKGGTVGGIEPYENEQTDFSDPIRRLVRSERRKGGDQPPRVDFDALFVPDSSLKARLIAPQLAFHDVIGVRLLGMSEWNVPELLQGETDYLEGSIFVDALFRESHSFEVIDFLDRFYAAYGREADGIEALAYDSTNMIADALLNHGVRSRQELRDWLLGMGTYAGVTGETSFSKNGDAVKTIYILMIQDGRIVQIQ